MTKTDKVWGMIDINNVLQLWTIRKQRKQSITAFEAIGGYTKEMITYYNYKPVKVTITYEVKDE